MCLADTCPTLRNNGVSPGGEPCPSARSVPAATGWRQVFFHFGPQTPSRQECQDTSIMTINYPLLLDVFVLLMVLSGLLMWSSADEPVGLSSFRTECRKLDRSQCCGRSRAASRLNPVSRRWRGGNRGCAYGSLWTALWIFCRRLCVSFLTSSKQRPSRIISTD